MIRLQSADGKLFVDASPRDTKNIKLIAGSRYRKDRDVWECPLNLATFTAIRKMYGMNLSVAESALRAEKKLEHSAHLQEVARKDYSVIAKEPRLYSFQNAGVRFLGKGKQVLLADEMGTGKTVQALTTLELANAFPALIVCTNSMKHKWAEEVQTWTSATPVVVEGTASKRRKLIASCQELDKFVVVINYESLRLHSKLGSFGNTVTSAEESKTKELNEIDFVTVIADEVHKAKEPKATLLAPVVLASKACEPTAVLELAVVLAIKAPLPRAVLSVPVVFAAKVFLPTAVLLSAVVLTFKACIPSATLLAPVVLANKAL